MTLSSLQKLETQLSEHYHQKHVTMAADGVYMGCLRNNIELDTLMNDIESGDAFQWSDFSEAESGNLSNMAPEYYDARQSLD